MNSALAGNWKAIELNTPDTLGEILIDHGSVEIQRISADKDNDLFMFRWALSYHEPIQLWENKPLVAHRVMEVAMTCKNNAKYFGVWLEEFWTKGFDVIKKIKYDLKQTYGIFEVPGDQKLIADVYGMDKAREYVCANRDKWHVNP